MAKFPAKVLNKSDHVWVSLLAPRAKSDVCVHIVCRARVAGLKIS